MKRTTKPSKSARKAAAKPRRKAKAARRVKHEETPAVEETPQPVVKEEPPAVEVTLPQPEAPMRPAEPQPAPAAVEEVPVEENPVAEAPAGEAPEATPETHPREPKFEWFQDKEGKFRFRLKAPNGEIIAVGEAYDSKEGCVNGIESMKKNAPIAAVVEFEPTVKRVRSTKPRKPRTTRTKKEPGT